MTPKSRSPRAGVRRLPGCGNAPACAGDDARPQLRAAGRRDGQVGSISGAPREPWDHRGAPLDLTRSDTRSVALRERHVQTAASCPEVSTCASGQRPRPSGAVLSPIASLKRGRGVGRPATRSRHVSLLRCAGAPLRAWPCSRVRLPPHPQRLEIPGARRSSRPERGLSVRAAAAGHTSEPKPNSPAFERQTDAKAAPARQAVQHRRPHLIVEGTSASLPSSRSGTCQSDPPRSPDRNPERVAGARVTDEEAAGQHAGTSEIVPCSTRRPCADAAARRGVAVDLRPAEVRLRRLRAGASALRPSENTLRRERHYAPVDADVEPMGRAASQHAAQARSHA